MDVNGQLSSQCLLQTLHMALCVNESHDAGENAVVCVCVCVLD